MSSLPDREQQMLAVHAAFIRQLVESAQTPGREQDVETLLQSARENGWTQLVATLRKIIGGSRSPEVLAGLDEEDSVIATAVMRGLQNPATLPPADAKPDATLAAPGLAGMIQAAASGNPQALQLVANMAEQMSKAGGDMAQLAGIIRPLINGERDPERLCKGMSSQGEQLVLNILKELGSQHVH